MRTSIRELRRRELIEATREVIEEVGFEKATVAMIAEKAGFSIGFMHHHFNNRDELLAETILVLYGDMPRFLVSRLRGTTNPLDRLRLIIEANFRSEQFTVGNARAWLSFLARVPFNNDYLRIQRALTGRLRSNLMHELRQLLPASDASLACEELAALVDGYWARLATDPELISPDKAIELMNLALERILNSPQNAPYPQPIDQRTKLV